MGIASSATELGLGIKGLAPSGLPGPKGNLETFLWCSPEAAGLDDLEAAVREVEP